MQDDRIEPPSAGQTIPYEDYSAASTIEEEEGGGTTEHSMKPQSSSKGAHKKTTKQQHNNARPSRKRSSSSISSSSSSDSSSSSSIFSSSDDNSGASDGDGDRSAGKKKKRKKKAAATGTKQPSSSSRGGQQTRRRGGGTDTADDGSINKLISVALKSQKKQYKNQSIQSVKSDLMNTLRSRIVQQHQRGKKATTKGGSAGEYDDEDDGGETTVRVDGGSTDKEYRKRIKQAYKEHEEGYDDAPKFNSKHHKKTIGSILSKLGEVNDIELFRIPHIDKEMGLDRMEISARDTKLSKKMLSASPEKTIPEAVYAARKDAYSSCMLYKYFFKRIFPYITVPYITSK